MDAHQSQDSDEELIAPSHGSSENASLHPVSASNFSDKPHLIGDREGRIRCILGSACTNPQGSRGHKISAYVTWHSGNVCKDCSAHFCCKGCNRRHRLPNGRCNITLFKGRLYPYELWEAAVAHRQGIVGQKRSRISEDHGSDPAPAAARSAAASMPLTGQEQRLSEQFRSNWLTSLQEAPTWHSLEVPAKDEENCAQPREQHVQWLRHQLHQHLQLLQLQQHLQQRNASSSSSQLLEQPTQHEQQHQYDAAAAAATTKHGHPPNGAAVRSQSAAAAAAAVPCEIARAAGTPALLDSMHVTTQQAVNMQQLQQQLEDALQENAALRQQLSSLQGERESAAVNSASQSALQQQLMDARREAAAYKREAAVLRQVLATAQQFSSVLLPVLTGILETDNVQQLQQQLGSAEDMQRLVHDAAAAAAAASSVDPVTQQHQQHDASMHLLQPKAAAATDLQDHCQDVLSLLLQTAADGGRLTRSLVPSAAAAAAAVTAAEAACQPLQRPRQHQPAMMGALPVRPGSSVVPAGTDLNSSSAPQELSAILMQPSAAAAAAADARPLDPAAIAASIARVAALVQCPAPEGQPEAAPAAAAAAAAATAAAPAIPDAQLAGRNQVPTELEREEPADDVPPGGVPGVRYCEYGVDNSNTVHAQQQQQQQGARSSLDPAAVAADLLVSLSRFHSAGIPS